MDVVVDTALGTSGMTVVKNERLERSESEDDMGAWEDAAEHDGGED